MEKQSRVVTSFQYLEGVFLRASLCTNSAAAAVWSPALFFQVMFYEVFKMGTSLSKRTDIAWREINNLGAICRRQRSGKRAI